MISGCLSLAMLSPSSGYLRDALSRTPACTCAIMAANGVAATSFGGRQDFRSLLKNNENPL